MLPARWIGLPVDGLGHRIGRLAQLGQEFDGLFEAQPADRCLDGDRRHDPLVGITHRHGQTADAGEVFLVVTCVAVGANGFEFTPQTRRVGESLLSMPDQRGDTQETLAAALGQVRQEQLAACLLYTSDAADE